eukprot:scaffold95524_cov66-Phaeocystis_antarctica.AAC.5
MDRPAHAPVWWGGARIRGCRPYNSRLQPNAPPCRDPCRWHSHPRAWSCEPERPGARPSCLPTQRASAMRAGGRPRRAESRQSNQRVPWRLRVGSAGPLARRGNSSMQPKTPGARLGTPARAGDGSGGWS